MNPRPVPLPEGRLWLRVTKPDWTQPLDPEFARESGGRWNPPGSFPTLYLNADVVTARLQIERLCEDTPVSVDDLADDAFALVAATLPTAQTGTDAVSDEGLAGLGLPRSYPLDSEGDPIDLEICQAVGAEVRRQRSQGVWCRSACTADGRGRELAWFPAGLLRAIPVWAKPRPFGAWRHAEAWRDLGEAHQPDPE